MQEPGGVRWSKQNQQAQIPLNPPKKASHWRLIFEKYDLDHDGKISLYELRAMIQSESYDHDIPEDTVRRIMQKADEDQSGYLECHEFEKMHWRAVFEKFDVNNDGRISLRELKRMLSAYNDNDIPHITVKRLLQMADTNRDEYLSFEEFEKLVHMKEFRSLMGHMINAYVRSTVVPRRLREDEVDGTGEYEEEYSCTPPQLFMVIISILELLVFLIDAIAEGKIYADGQAAKVMVYDPKRRYQAWRYLSYMFCHVGVFHLVVNLLVQVLLGTPLEMVHKWWRVLILYLAGVAAGSLGTSISDPHVRLAGASGGVYALITAHVASIIMNWSEMRFAPLQLVVFFILAGSDIGTAVYNRYINGVLDSTVSYSAHLAGALAGLLLGIRVLRNLNVKKWETLLSWAAIVLYCVLMLAAIIWNIAYSSYYPKQLWD